ncbi:MAG: NAD(+) synthase [Clostridia bacterium]|nr:NAD(+) synthase [Clostridia bacterium]
MTIKEQAIQWIKDYFEKNGNSETKAIIGISGGKDSSVVAALCCAALGKERVIGVMMPNGVQSDIADSIKLCNFLGIKNYTVNIGSAYEALSKEIKTVTQTENTTPQFNTNTPSRLRMSTLYGIAALDGNARISCNGNYSERLAGYFTIWGDGAGDFAPLANLFVDEVVQLGLDLGLPEDLCVKAPADGMSGKTDEDNLGFTYAELKKVATGNEAEVEPDKVQKIKTKLKNLDFKRKLLNLPCFEPKR